MRSALAGCAIGVISLAAYANGGKGAAPDPRTLEAGRKVYQTHCASCHGARAEGVPNWERPNEQGEMPPPPHDVQGHTWRHSDAMLYGTIRDGWRDPFNKTERLTMPPFGQTLSRQEIRAIIAYLKTLWTPEQRRFQQKESRRAPFPPEAQ